MRRSKNDQEIIDVTKRLWNCHRVIGVRKNQSPKGNMWSAIPVALLCMLAIDGDGKQGSGPKGDNVL